MATEKDNCTRKRFARKVDLKYGYHVKDNKDRQEKRVL